MPRRLVMAIDGSGLDECEQVNAHVGVDPEAETPDWPPGLLSHAARATTSGRMAFDVWESIDAHPVFTDDGLAPALLAVGGVPAHRIAWSGLTSRPLARWRVPDRTIQPAARGARPGGGLPPRRGPLGFFAVNRVRAHA